jgi:membrane-bound lytic murein transglycosylase B
VRDALRKRFAGAKPADVVQGTLEILREVSAVLAAKAPGDVPAFKAWLNNTSRKVAEASAERGGVQVSDAEKAMLAEISKALGTRV